MFDCIEALKALGEENRIRIIRLLLERERNVTEIADELGMTHYNASKHLRVLRTAGLIEMKKHGQLHNYSLVSDFRAHLTVNPNVLDLGCCTFNFDRLPLS